MSSIEAYAGATSVFQGDAIDFHVSNAPNLGSPPSFTIRVYRVLTGEDLVHTASSAAQNHDYPALSYRAGCGWPSAYTLNVPGDWPSALYKAVLTNADGAQETVYFVVKSAMPGEDYKILFMWPVTTYLAYHKDTSGNPNDRDLYDSYEAARSRVVSFDRPNTWPRPGDNRTHGEFDMWAWMHERGYSPDACTSLDIHDDADFLGAYQLLLSVGHDEYWSKEMRDNAEAFITQGGNIAFFSANTCWWQLRLEDDGRTMVCCKSAIDDPLTGDDDERVTINWSSAPVNRPENSLTGVSYRNGGGGWGEPWWTETYRVRAASHWVFAGTGLANGAAFGRGVVGYETDTALFKDVNDVPTPTGKDGSPLNLQILATADLRHWRYSGQGGFATMGVYTNGGTVFTAGAVDWGGGLGDPVIARITANVVNKLSQPAPGPAYSLPVLNWPPHAWEYVGAAPDILAMTGYVERLLFAVNANDQLLVREPVGEEVPWQYAGPAEGVKALAVPAIGLGQLIGANGDDELVLREPVSAGAPWELTLEDIRGVVALACMYPEQLYLVNDDQELWLVNIKSGDELLIGSAPEITALAAHDGKLFAATADGSLLCRETVAANIEWTIIDQVPDGTRALGAYNGALFAATDSDELWWRTAACMPAPLYTGGLLFYDATDGRGATSRFADNGDLETLQAFPDPDADNPAFSADWTHLAGVGGGRTLFYNYHTGHGATGATEADGTFTTLAAFPDPGAGNPAFAADWSLVVPLAGGLVLFYNRQTGDGAVGQVDEAGGFVTLQVFPDPASGNPAFAKGWTHAVAARGNLILFYNSQDGSGAVGQASEDGSFVTLQVFPDPASGNPAFAEGWTHLTPSRDGLVLFYNDQNGDGAIGQVGDDGGFSTLQVYPDPGAGLTAFSAGWTHVVAAASGLILFYDKQTGSGVAAGLTVSGKFVPLLSYGKGAFSVGWTHITACGVG